MRLLPFVLLIATAVQAQPAEAIYHNARIWTGNAAQPWAEALAVRGETLVAVGSDAGVLAQRGPQTHVLDMDGLFVVPGFIDNHVHFVDGGDALGSVALRDAASPEAFTQRLAAFAQGRSADRWITGGDWDHEAWGGNLPTRHWIDTGTGNVPVFVRRLDGHMALANTAALQRAGITRDTPDPDGGTIVRDEAGEPTGILKDNAMDLVYAVMPEMGADQLEEAITQATAHAAAHGITQVHDVSAGGVLDTYRRMHDEGRLKTRIYGALPLSRWETLVEYIAAHGHGDDWVRWGLLKGFVDGSLGSTTAWFYDPFTDEPETSGFPVADTVVLREQILAADAAGLHVAVHAIGDRANEWLLATFAYAARTNGPRDRRFRIEHAQHLTPQAIEAFAAQQVIPSMQPYHAIDDGRWAERRIGPMRIQTTYPFRSLLDARAPLTFGSDWFVAPLDPIAGIYAAVTRRTLDGANPGGWVPSERITVEEALRAYTSANAFAGFQESRAGTLEAGKLADFVVLSENLFEIAPERIADVQVLRTVVGGRTVYETLR